MDGATGNLEEDQPPKGLKRFKFFRHFYDSEDDPSLRSVYQIKRQRITFRVLLKCLTGNSLYYLISCLVFAAITCLSLLWSYPFFWFVTEVYLLIFATLLFAILILSHHKIWNGFFMILGFGYGGVSIVRLIVLQSNPWIDTKIIDADEDRLNITSQLRTISTFAEIATFVVSLCFARKTYVGYRAPATVFGLVVLYIFVTLSSILWWHSFPDSFDGNGKRTRFSESFMFIAPIGFAAALVGMVIQRNSFDPETFLCLFIAIFFRTISTSIASIGKSDYTQNSGSVTVHIFRLLGFMYLFSAAGITTLRRPTKTLFRNLKRQEEVVKYEKTFTEWMINQVPAIVVLLNRHAEVTHTNTVASNMFNIEHLNVLGKSFEKTFVKDGDEEFSLSDLISKDAVGTGSNVYEAVHPITGQVIEWRFSRFKLAPDGPDEEDFEDEFDLPEIETDQKSENSSNLGDRVVVLCLGQDITDKRERENLLTKAKNEAQLASEMKDTFVANVSHELRTPLNCIVGITSLMENSFEMNKSQMEMVKMISSAAGVLLDLINDLLDVNSIRQGTMHLYYAAFDLRKFIEEIISSVNLHPTFVEKVEIDLAYRVHYSCPTELYLDKKRLRQVIVNLLSNAIKFTNQGQIILNIKVVHDAEAGERPYILFEVKDSGVGIKTEDLTKLFRRFSQINGNSQKYTGTGIGLHISKQLVEMMGGTFHVTSEEGIGSNFYFKVPLMRDGGESYEIAPTLASKTDSNSLTVLVSLKNDVIANLIAKTLRRDSGIGGAESVGLNKLMEIVEKTVDKSPKRLAIIVETSKFCDIDVATLRRLKSTLVLVIVIPSRETSDIVISAHQRLLEDEGIIVKVTNRPLRHSNLVDLLLHLEFQVSKALHRTQEYSPSKLENRLSLSLSSDAKMHILVAEDNLVNQKVLKMLISKLNFVTMEMVGDGQEAVDTFQKSGPFDLILMDCQMPVMDGFTATKLIRQYERDKKLKPVTIYAFSANALEEEKREFLNAGMDGSIVKPVNLNTLKEKILSARN